MPIWNSYSFQDANSPIIEQLTFFHDSTIIILTAIITIISYLLIYITFNKLTNRYLLNRQNIELLWTITPAVTLLFIALPSLKILYLIDDITNPIITIKAIGHQWYWSYEYSDFKNIEFESYIKLPSEINENEFRLLETNNRTILPIHTSIRLLTTSTDVIHSWTVPSLGVKIDAIPGRLNQRLIIINRPGLIYGQCSEICGANHRFMPIVLERISIQRFIKWINLYSLSGWNVKQWSLKPLNSKFTNTLNERISFKKNNNLSSYKYLIVFFNSTNITNMMNYTNNNLYFMYIYIFN